MSDDFGKFKAHVKFFNPTLPLFLDAFMTHYCQKGIFLSPTCILSKKNFTSAGKSSHFLLLSLKNSLLVLLDIQTSHSYIQFILKFTLKSFEFLCNYHLGQEICGSICNSSLNHFIKIVVLNQNSFIYKKWRDLKYKFKL